MQIERKDIVINEVAVPRVVVAIPNVVVAIPSRRRSPWADPVALVGLCIVVLGCYLGWLISPPFAVCMMVGWLVMGLRFGSFIK